MYPTLTLKSGNELYGLSTLLSFFCRPAYLMSDGPKYRTEEVEKHWDGRFYQTPLDGGLLCDVDLQVRHLSVQGKNKNLRRQTSR